MRRFGATTAAAALLLGGCGAGDEAVFCGVAEELRVEGEELVALVAQEGVPSGAAIRAHLERTAELSGRLADTAPDDAPADLTTRAAFHRAALERFDAGEAEFAGPGLDPDGEEMFRHTESYVRDQCGVDLGAPL